MGSWSVRQNPLTLLVERLPGLQPVVCRARQNFIGAPASMGSCARAGRPRCSLWGWRMFLGSPPRPWSSPFRSTTRSGFSLARRGGGQVAYRDPQAGGVGPSLSPGLRVQICPRGFRVWGCPSHLAGSGRTRTDRTCGKKRVLQRDSGALVASIDGEPRRPAFGLSLLFRAARLLHAYKGRGSGPPGRGSASLPLSQSSFYA